METDVSLQITDTAFVARGRLRLAELQVTSKNGGARRDRTDDIVLAKHALSQLSYGPKLGAKRSRKCRRFRTSGRRTRLLNPRDHGGPGKI